MCIKCCINNFGYKFGSLLLYISLTEATSVIKKVLIKKHVLLSDFKNKKTVLYAVGFLDSSVWPQSQAIGTAYSKRGYNVFITETFPFLSYIYPK